MDENTFFEELDKKLKYYLEPIMDYIDTQKVIRDFNLSDQSKKQPRESSGRKRPEQIGKYTIGKDGCNKCGGKITWDLYDKESGHGYPDHVSEDGKLIDCPEY